MADNVQVTQGSGTIVATDQRSIDGSSVHIQRVDEIGAANWQHDQNATITTTAGLIAAARETRKRICVVNQGSVNCYLGNSAVTSSTGILLKPNASIALQHCAAVYGRTSSGTATLHYWEEYD